MSNLLQNLLLCFCSQRISSCFFFTVEESSLCRKGKVILVARGGLAAAGCVTSCGRVRDGAHGAVKQIIKPESYFSVCNTLEKKSKSNRQFK